MARFAWMVTLSFVFVLGCGEKGDDSSVAPSPPTVAPTKTAPTKPVAETAGAKGAAIMIFKTRCVLCHGVDGAGNGPASATLNPKPRNYKDPKWQDSVDDKKLAEIIVKGGKAAALSAAMPPNPDLAAKPEVVAELVKMIRSFRKE